MSRVIFFSMLFIVLILIDLYIFQAIKTVTQNLVPNIRKTIHIVFWLVTVVSLLSILIYQIVGREGLPPAFRSVFFSMVVIVYVSKVFGVLALMIDDVVRFGQWAWAQFKGSSPDVAPIAEETGEKISRSEFLAKTSLIASAVPAITMGYGILSGAHDYRVRRVKVALPNLPKSFDGLRIAQLSDIHSGSFFNKTAVQGGVDMLLAEKPDVVFFTGDLVNNETTEVKEYFDTFSKVNAPLGVFSTTGNHDYGDYRNWPSQQARQQNFQDLIEAHKLLGWNLLMNEHRFLQEGNDKIAIIGIENWGAGRFSKYGKLDKAYKGTEEAQVKLLLSHDPSHWDAQVRPHYKDIDIAFAGHTHGFQFGVEIGDFKWSPSQYLYKQWAGLYQENEQYLYVNRGFGYIGYPGRVGILPEITVLELVCA